MCKYILSIKNINVGILNQNVSIIKNNKEINLTNELNPDLIEIHFNLITYTPSMMLFKWKIIILHFMKKVDLHEIFQ